MCYALSLGAIRGSWDFQRALWASLTLSLPLTNERPGRVHQIVVVLELGEGSRVAWLAGWLAVSHGFSPSVPPAHPAIQLDGVVKYHTLQQ